MKAVSQKIPQRKISENPFSVESILKELNLQLKSYVDALKAVSETDNMTN